MCLCIAVLPRMLVTALVTALAATGIQEITMARKHYDSNLKTRTARLKLPMRATKKPYFITLPGGRLGYRRTKTGNNGRWSVEAYLGNREYKKTSFADADDYAEADGEEILTYAQAYAKAQDLISKPASRNRALHGPAGVRGLS